MLDSKNFFDNIRNVARAFSSVGRASPLQGEGQKFESSNAHHLKRHFYRVSFFHVYVAIGLGD